MRNKAPGKESKSGDLEEIFGHKWSDLRGGLEVQPLACIYIVLFFWTSLYAPHIVLSECVPCPEQRFSWAGAAPRSLPVKFPMALATPVPHQKALVFTWGLSLISCWNHLVGKIAQLGGLWVFANWTFLHWFLNQCFSIGSNFAP